MAQDRISNIASVYPELTQKVERQLINTGKVAAGEAKRLAEVIVSGCASYVKMMEHIN